MASTRNINTFGNYCLEQKTHKNSENYTLYKNSQYGEAYVTKLPGNGLLPGQISWNNLSDNYVDIESFLFGINSTNLVNPEKPLVPKLKCLDSENIYKTQPVYMPQELVVSRNQRPFPVPK